MTKDEYDKLSQDEKEQTIAVLGIPPVNSPEAAVRAAIADHAAQCLMAGVRWRSVVCANDDFRLETREIVWGGMVGC